MAMPIEYGLLKRDIFDFLGVGRGQSTPEIERILSFYTAWVDLRLSAKPSDHPGLPIIEAPGSAPLV
jgi:hypothetical protein